MKAKPKPHKPPQNATQLVQGLLRSEIDGRTKEAQAFLATRAVVHEVGHGNMAAALLQDQLAAWAIAQSLIISDIAQAKEVFQGGELSPLFEQLQRCEASILKISKALQSMDTQQVKADGKAQAPVFDVSSLMDEDGAP